MNIVAAVSAKLTALDAVAKNMGVDSQDLIDQTKARLPPPPSTTPTIK